MGIKSPPRRYPPPPPPPPAIRIFGRVRAFEVACPSCGHVAAPGGKAGGRLEGYDRTTGVWECLGCHRAWTVGLLLWSRPLGSRQGRPGDQTPTLAEAVALREALAYATPEKIRGGRAGKANGVCTCEMGCPMHTPVEGPGEGAEP